jgi:hypothetical protein
MPTRFALASILLFNAIPLYGAFFWGWQAFELVFLYWFENLVIGVFTLWRFLLRPYDHPIALVIPLFFAPFFLLHYGIFCLGHGAFVFAMFGEGTPGTGLFSPLRNLPLVLSRDGMALAAIGLVLLQLVDWIRDLRENGLGADNVIQLMTRPYRRIIVLHVTIMAAGFLLVALEEPVVGLAALVFVKTYFDIYHWRKDEQRASEAVAKPDFKVEGMVDELERRLAKPVVTVNGKEIHHQNLEEFRESRDFRLLAVFLRAMGKGKELRFIEDHMDKKIAEQNRN